MAYKFFQRIMIALWVFAQMEHTPAHGKILHHTSPDRNSECPSGSDVMSALYYFFGGCGPTNFRKPLPWNLGTVTPNWLWYVTSLTGYANTPNKFYQSVCGGFAHLPLIHSSGAECVYSYQWWAYPNRKGTVTLQLGCPPGQVCCRGLCCSQADCSSGTCLGSQICAFAKRNANQKSIHNKRNRKNR